MSSITWTISQNAQTNYYWKEDPDSVSIELGTSAYPLLIFPKVEFPRRISFSIQGASNNIINFFYARPTSTAEHLNVLDAVPDFQARIGHQQLNWDMSTALYAKKTDSNEFGITIVYRSFTQQAIL